MNYSKIYYKIIDRRKNNPYNGYVERHHILPKSLGGSDSIENLVDLTAREHFLCHLLLTKMYQVNTPEYFKMIKAFVMMLTCKSKNQQRVLNSKRYEFLRIEFSEAMRLSQLGSNNSQFGKTKSVELKNKIRESVSKTLAVKGLGKVKKLKQQKRIQNEIDRKKELDLYREYYIIYKKVGFDEFVKQTGYDKSKPNLVQRFKKLLPEFKPQNGKRRGK